MGRHSSASHHFTTNTNTSTRLAPVPNLMSGHLAKALLAPLPSQRALCIWAKVSQRWLATCTIQPGGAAHQQNVTGTNIFALTRHETDKEAFCHKKATNLAGRTVNASAKLCLSQFVELRQFPTVEEALMS